MHALARCVVRAVKCSASARSVAWRRRRLHGAGADRPAEGGADEASPLRRLLDGAATYGEGGGAAAAEADLQWATQPYPARPRPPPPPERPDPRDSVVLLFPGQGAQHVGMGRSLLRLPAVKDLYDLASETLKWDVLRVCLEGPSELLARHCQVCVLVTSLAALEAARDARPDALERARAAAGFSLGEITALVFAGALPLEGALRLVELRAAAMAAAAAARPPGGMLTVWLAPDHRLPAALRAARDYALEAGAPEPLCEVANYLYPNCKVVAGDEAALAWLEARGGAWGVRRAARVPVAGPWHTRGMRAAGAAVRAALDALEVRAPRLRVLSNVDARAYRDAAHVRRQLARHVSAPVRWEQVLHALYARAPGQRFPQTLALGPGRTLRATLKQVNAKAWDSSVQIDV